MRGCVVIELVQFELDDGRRARPGEQLGATSESLRLVALDVDL